MKMKFDELTPSQQAAVRQQGSVIVSAAAGSGKTAVLVQRIVDRLTSKENLLSADRLLVVTFTVAAAAEMRSRIEKELDIYCKNNLDDKYAAKQKLLIRSAKICTIDSFCIDLVRENFAKANVSPDFKIAEEKDIAAIKDTAANIVFSNYFAARDEEFLNLLDAFGSIYDEKNLVDAVDEIFERSQNMPFPQAWLSQMLSAYSENAIEKWCELGIVEANKLIKTAMRYINAAKEICEKDSEVKNAYLPNFICAEEQCEKILEFCNQNAWDDILRSAKAFSFGKFGSVKGSKENPVAVMAKKFRELCEKSIKKIDALLTEDKNLVKEHFIEGAPSGKKLIEITKAYCDEIDKIKKEKNIYNFSDIEHFAFSLICDESDGEIFLKEDADEYINEYDEILVDEYQDVNNLQDRFFYFLSGYGSHLFVVGDVKQSIYGFRGANPDNFISAVKGAVDYTKADETDRKSINLDANFRSRNGVCEAVNFLFDRLMTEENCGIDYAKTERLSPKAGFPEIDIPVSEFHLVDSKGENEKEAEAKHIAAYIKKIMQSGAVIKDKHTKGLRQASYGDFAVIVRAMKGNASILVNAFNEAGIPVTYAKDSFLESKEISIMLWVGDGSEMLDYDGDLNKEFEWAYFIGTANLPLFDEKKDDPAVSLHSKKRYYMENPPKMTYAILKNIISIFKQEGAKRYPNAKITIGETFDIGPEFAISDFKYNRHQEILGSVKFYGKYGLIDSTLTLNVDTRKYAAYPNGIPQDTPFATFAGKQANVF
jgi:ATP-dependent helicase/nuclease subunit A